MAKYPVLAICWLPQLVASRLVPELLGLVALRSAEGQSMLALLRLAWPGSLSPIALRDGSIPQRFLQRLLQ